MGGVLFLLMLLLTADPYVTALVRLEDLSAEDKQRLLAPTPGIACPLSFHPIESLVITDRRSRIERLLHRSIPLGR